MDTVYSENNHIIMVGKVTSDKRFSHEIYGEKFYIFDLSVPRLSGNSDIIPITISERLMVNGELPIGTKITVEGQFRSYNSYGEGKNKLVLTVFAKNVTLLEDQESEVEARKDFISNEVTLIGYICKKPVYRQTPFGREIADILLAVNRAYSKSDYIPCIAWGRTARFCENMEVGTEVKLVGRVQSRQYEKKHEDGTVENKVAYEVSVGSLEVVNQKDDGEAEEAPVEENKEANEIPVEAFDMMIGNIIDDKEVQDKVGYEKYDIVAANILADVLVPLTPVIIHQLKKGGIYITSGIIEDKEEVVVEAVKKAGLEVLEVNHQGEWVSVTARKN